MRGKVAPSAVPTLVQAVPTMVKAAKQTIDVKVIQVDKIVEFF